ncbi:MAG: hypothetical protein HEQ22_09905 [Sphingopyxis sp.]
MAWPIAIFIGTAMLAGGFAGYSEARVEHGQSALSPWAGAMIAIALGAAAFALYVRRHADWFARWSPRKRLYWISILLAGALGLVSAIMLQAGGNADLLSDSALTPALASGLSVLWVAGLTVALILYHRTVDDHERDAYNRAALAGFYAFIFPCPVWWVLARADLAPPVEAMPLFALSMAVNAVVYCWFKFR